MMFMLKYFTGANILLEDGRIVEIDGLMYNEETNEYEIDNSCITKRAGRKAYGLGVEKRDKTPEVNFLDIWAKYLESLETKRLKKNHTHSSSYFTTNNESDDLTKSDYYTS